MKKLTAVKRIDGGSVKLSKEIDDRLNLLCNMTGQTKGFAASFAIEQYLNADKDFLKYEQEHAGTVTPKETRVKPSKTSAAAGD